MLSKRRGPRAHTLLAMFLLAIMLGSPLIPGIATADLARARDGEEADTTEEMSQDQSTEEAVPEEPTEPVQEPATEAATEPVEPTAPLATSTEDVHLVAPTPSPTATETNQLVDGGIEIAKHYCPPGYDAGNKTYEEMLVDCDDAGPAAAFTVSGARFQHAMSVKANASVVLRDVPRQFGAGETVTISEEVPVGYNDPVVFCSWVPEAAIQFKGSPQNERVVSFEIHEIPGYWPTPSYELVCDFFNMQAPANSQLVIEKFACPPEFDAASASVETLIAECDEPMPGVGFALSADGLETRQPTNDDGMLVVDDVPPGPVMIEENMPDGYDGSVVYCAQADATGALGPYEELLTFGDLGTQTDITIDGSGDTYTCLWFNIPEGESDDGGLDDPGTPPDNPVDPPMLVGPLMLTGGQTGEIDMHVLLCQPGYTFETFTIADMGDCIPGEPGVTFTATDGAGYSETTAPSDGSWRVFFDNVPMDAPITITRDVPSGLGAQFATCDQGNGVLTVAPADFGFQTTVETPTAGAAVERCIWFTVGTSGVPTVSVDNHLCPPTLPFDPATATYDQFRLVCDLPGANIQFETYDSEIEGPYERPVTDSNGHFDHEVEPGALVTVVQTTPDGYGPVHVFCNYGSADVPAGPYLRPADVSDDFARSHPLAGGYTWDCQWFNVLADAEHPDPTVDIFVTKYLCAPWADLTALDSSDIPTECDAEPGVIDFTASNGAYQTPLIAEGGNVYTATGVPSGEVTVAEPDSATARPMATQCVVEDPAANSRTALPIAFEANSFTATLTDGQILRCNWFNEYADTRPGLVVINKAFCPEDFDAHNASLIDISETCLTPPADETRLVEFTLTADGYSSTQAINDIDQGILIVDFDQVPAGPITIAENVPAGYGEPVVFCAYTIDLLELEDDAEFGAGYFDLPVTNGNAVTLDYSAADSLHCAWVNVPEVDGDAPTEEPTEEPTEGPTEQPTEEPTEQPTEQPTEEPTEQPTEEPAGEDAVFLLAARDCTGLAGASSLSYEELQTSCGRHPSLTIMVTGDGQFSETKLTDGLGRAGFDPVPPGELQITGELLEGYGEPIVYCSVLDPATMSFVQAVQELVPTVNGTFTYTLAPGDTGACVWFSMAAGDDTATVTVIKYACPEGTSIGGDESFYMETCALASGIEFRITHGHGSAMGVTDAGGEYTWSDVPLGPVTLQEYIPTGYGEPVVFCNYTYTERPMMDSTGGHIAFELTRTGDWICLVYNIPGEHGDLTIVKHTCPEGYDPHAWNADPKAECAEGPNGIVFTATSPNGYQQQSATGDSVQYGVVFGDLEPGSYTVTEQVPEGIGLVFVWDCYGQMMGELRPTPLSVGPPLTIEIGADETITCHWYNVPHDPDGSLTVIKYTCATQVYVSEVDCEVYEGGQGFDLAWWNGDAWEIIANGTTGAAGSYTWNDLDAGEYWLDERDREWCQMTSDGLSDDGNWLNVVEGEETIVKVYNCTGEPGKPGKTPIKYPNTGVPMREEWRLTA